jgi:7,8-dihydropterin-6-yl-methyl-4-(beta-D-ribofuranosyl)aminobenzene 5'-phosphate synthase
MLRKLLILTLFIAILISYTSVAPTASVTEASYTRSETHVAQYTSTGTVPDTTLTLPPRAMGDLKLTILIDNTACRSKLKSEWGFATLIEYGGHMLLFDTGASGFNLLGNMRQLGVDFRSIEAVILSHEHNDHINGLEALLERGVRPTVYAPSTFTNAFKERVRAQTKLIEVVGALEILPGVHITRPIGFIAEQALVVKTRDGTVVITGCAHPGVVEIVRQAQEVVKGKISLLVGGFHLLHHSKNQLLPIIAELRQLGVQKILPAHCTGDEAIALLRTDYREYYVEGGVGRTVIFSAK